VENPVEKVAVFPQGINTY